MYTLTTGLKKGIKQIADLLDINGNLYQFDVLQEIYGINGTILDYQPLIRKIPNQCENMIITIDWFLSRQNIDLDVRKPVFRVCD